MQKCKFGHKVKQQKPGVSKHNQNCSPYRLFFFTKRKAVLSEALESPFWATEAQQGLEQLFPPNTEGPALHRGFHSFILCPWITASAAGQTCVHTEHTETLVLSHKGQATSTVGNTLYQEKGIESLGSLHWKGQNQLPGAAAHASFATVSPAIILLACSGLWSLK